MNFNPEVYGRNAEPEFIPETTAAPKPAFEQLGAVEPGVAFGGSAVAAEAATAQASAALPKPTVMEAVSAAMQSTDTAAIINAYNKPNFTPDPKFNINSFIGAINTPLTETELNFIVKGSESAEDAQWHYDQVLAERKYQSAIAEHAIIGGAFQMIDPVHLAIDIASGGVSKVFQAGRVAAAVGAAVGTAVAGTVAAEGAPRDYRSIYVNAMLNGAATGLSVGGKPHDPSFPSQALSAAALKKEAPMPLEAAAKAVDRTLAQRIGDTLQMNMHKTLSSYGTAGREIADLILDNNSDLSKNSVEAVHRAVRQSLENREAALQAMVRKQMAADGVGLWTELTQPRKAAAKQVSLETELSMELYRREQLSRQGITITHDTVPPYIKEMADMHDQITAQAVQELTRAGVKGAENLAPKTGWATRKWNSASIEAMQNKFMAAGRNAKQAHQDVVRLLKGSLRRANGWDDELAYDISASIVNRALRRGHFEDMLFNAPQTAKATQEIKDLLVSDGLSGPRLKRAMDVLTGQVNESGKAGFLKHRVDLDYKMVARTPTGEMVRVVDMLDHNVITNMSRYLDGVASQVAFATKGLPDQSSIDALRKKLIGGIPDIPTREKAAKLFDNITNYLAGRPTGEAMNGAMRMMGQYGKLITLKMSGLWQATEYATLMQKYGLVSTTKHMLAEMPGFKQLMSTAAKDKQLSTELKDVLVNMADNDLRIKPYMQKFEDNYEMPLTSAAHLALQKAGQVVPYLNAMRTISRHQARVASNLVIDRLRKVATGNTKAAQALERYGLRLDLQDEVLKDIRLHGLDTAAWKDSTWDAVRPAFSKMMDEAVLRSRLGDVPAFAKFDQLGKFIFTYRTFMLTAHNKILAGTLAREGMAGTALLMMYQLPLTMMAVQAKNTLDGKKEMALGELASASVSQMGSLGIFADIDGAVRGHKSLGSSAGLIPVDRIGRFASSLYSESGDSAAAAFDLIPLLNNLPVANALQDLSRSK